ncbi:MAG: DUF2169 domain-containing protein [Myxococcota bacterium]
MSDSMTPRVENHTPWSDVLFERGDAKGRRYWVTVLQGSFSLVTRRPLQPLKEQEPIQLVDSFWGDPARSSVRRPGVLAFRKPRSDVTVNAVARSRRQQVEWPVRLQLGELESTLIVRGPHHWVRDDDDRWILTEPEPCYSVALVYENAFGGGGWVAGQRVEEPRNPLGTGFIPDGDAGTERRRAPQVVGLDEREHEPGQRHAPRGWGAIPSYFAPRTEHVGTCDAAWERTQWPRPPEDFDDAFYQVSPPELIYPGTLRGDEDFRIEGVTVSGEAIVGQLPGWLVFAIVHIGDGGRLLCPLALDHVHLDVLHPDPGKHRGYLTWRVVLPLEEAIHSLEIGMVSRRQLEGLAA